MNSADVRPFWGRAFLLATLMLVGVAIGVATTGFVTLRAVGNREVAWLDVAWPPRWPNLNRARARMFFASGMSALGERDFARARLSLESAVTIDPENYEAALLLAMLHAHSLRPEMGDAAFQWLFSRYPENAPRSAVAYHDALLAVGRPAQLAPFALWMARHDPGSAAIWVRALLVSVRLTGNAAEFSKQHAADLAQLPPSARTLIAAEILQQRHQAFTAMAGLQQPLDSSSAPLYRFLQIEQLLDLGDLRAAVSVRHSLVANVSPFHAHALQYLIDQKSGNTAAARAGFNSLVGSQITAAQIDWLVALLVRVPDAWCFGVLDRALRANPPVNSAASTGGAMWVAALACADHTAADYWAAFLRDRAQLGVPPAGEIDFGSLAVDQVLSVPGLLTVLPLPRETVYALYSRVRPHGIR